jgi:hypothetical protein
MLKMTKTKKKTFYWSIKNNPVGEIGWSLALKTALKAP